MNNDESPIPIMFEHCCKVYKAMREEAKTELQNTGETTRGILVYEGHLTTLFAKLELAVPYYTTVMTWLKDMGCVTQLRRGGGSAQSKWQLHGEPSEAGWAAAEARRPRRKTKKASENEILEQKLRDACKRIEQLEKGLETCARALEKLDDAWQAHYDMHMQARV